jgi:membrane fusion protein (multidrug efflux system)
MSKGHSTILPFFFVVVITGIFFVCGRSTGENKENQSGNQMPPIVRVLPASKAAISRNLDLTGSVEPYCVARLASPAEGPVVDVRVREGDRVKAGHVLISIGRKQGIDALIASLREELKKEQDNLQRTRQLVESGALPHERLDQADAAYEKVNAQFIKSEETARDYCLRAPWTGVISHVIVREGEFVAPRTPLLEMYDPSSLVIRTAVSEQYAVEVTAGMAVNVELDAYPNATLEGRIERVYPYLDPRLRTRTMEIALDSAIYMLPGMFARLKVLLKSEHEAIVVPVEAVVMRPKGAMVFIMDGGKAVGKPVKTGIEKGARIQITSGISAGDKVIVAGNEKLKDGVAVRLAGGSGKKSSEQTAAGHRKAESREQ